MQSVSCFNKQRFSIQLVFNPQPWHGFEIGQIPREQGGIVGQANAGNVQNLNANLLTWLVCRANISICPCRLVRAIRDRVMHIEVPLRFKTGNFKHGFQVPSFMIALV